MHTDGATIKRAVPKTELPFPSTQFRRSAFGSSHKATRSWGLAAVAALCLASVAQAVSPSISPWETLLSTDSTSVAEEDHYPEAIASGQTIHAVWTASIGYDLHHLCYRRSLDGGATWQARVILQDYGNDNWTTMLTGDTTRLAVDGENIHVIQLRAVPGWHYEIDYFRSTDGGATFEPKRTLSTSEQYWIFSVPRIAAGAGKVVVALSQRPNWYTNPTGHLLLSRDNGGTFAHAQVLDNAYGGYYECLDIKQAGDKLVSIWRTDGSPRFLAVTSTDSGTSLHTVALSSLVTETWSYPGYMRQQLCAITGDALHTAWLQRNASGRAALFYTRSLDGGVTFQAARDLSEGTIGTDEIRSGRVVMAAQGTHVYACYIANGSGGIWLRSSSDSGATFGTAVPLHLPGSSFLGNGEYPNLTLDPQDATGATAWFAFAVPSGYGGCSASVIGHTTDGGTTVAPLLVPARPWAWGNFTPHSFLLVPTPGPVGTLWTMLYVGSRPGYDGELFARRFTPEPGPSTNNKVLHLAPLVSALRYDMLEVPSVPALQFSNTLTAELWVRITHSSVAMQILQWGTGDDGLMFRCYPDPSGANRTVSGRFRTTTGIYPIGGKSIIDDGRWHHIALTYDANAGPSNLRFYFDAHLDHAVTATGAFIPVPEPLLVGGDLAGGSALDPLDGDVDSLRLWNRVLSDDEIRASTRQANPAGTESGLAAAFSFDGTVRDLTGHGADGLLQFGASYLDDIIVPSSLTLNASLVGSDLVLSWPITASGYSLQQNPDLDLTHWTDYAGPVTDNGTNRTVTFANPGGAMFFRLYSPSR